MIVFQVWSEHGDVIAQQYAGSGAMHRLDEVSGSTDTGADPSSEREFVLTGGAKNALVAAKRYYSNVLTDYDRQQAIDLMLGIFEPRAGESHVWQMKRGPEDLRVGPHGRRQSDMVGEVLDPNSNDEELDEVALQVL